MFRRWWVPGLIGLAALAGSTAARADAYVVERSASSVRFKAVRDGRRVRASRVPADIVCNANYYWEDRPLGVMIKDGRLISRGLRHKPPRTAFVVQNINGAQRVRIIEVAEHRGRIYSSAGRLDHIGTLVQAGPRLVRNGVIAVARLREGFRSDVARRTRHVGLGITKDGRVLVVAQENVTLWEFAHTFARLGARDAMNLDGGHSATLAVGRHVRMGSGSIVAGLAINVPKRRRPNL